MTENTASPVTLDQIAAELSLSGMALTMARCYIASAENWQRGDLGAGAVETYPGDLADRRAYITNPVNIEKMVRNGADAIIGTCRKGKEFSRTLTAERLGDALMLVIA